MTLTPRAFLLDLPETARYLVRDGREVLVEEYPGANRLDVSSYLTTWVFGALCHQNGLLPLHASAVSWRGQVTAFAADSGTGKSTLAACLLARGFPVVADDICLLEFGSGAERPRLLPVAAWLKLDRDAASLTGRRIADADRTFSHEEKYRTPLDPVDAEQGPAQHLDRIFFLSRDASLTQPVLTPVRGATALGKLLNKVYLGQFTEAAGLELRQFTQCSAVLRQAECFDLRVPPGLERLMETVERLEAILRG